MKHLYVMISVLTIAVLMEALAIRWKTDALNILYKSLDADIKAMIDLEDVRYKQFISVCTNLTTLFEAQHETLNAARIK